jgi:DNA polymerase-4
MTDTEDRNFVRRTLLALTEQVVARLRRRRLAAHTITVKLRLAPFDTLTKRRTMRSSMATTESIYPVACELLATADPGDRPVRLIGISVSGLHECEPDRQLRLFQEEGRREDNAQRVAEAVDLIADRFGHDALKRARLIGDVRDMQDEEEE